MHEKIIPMRIFRENAYLSRFIKQKETIYLKFLFWTKSDIASIKQVRPGQVHLKGNDIRYQCLDVTVKN